jgi:hypothetical protein
MTEPKKITWPEGKQFAFTVFDDTDFATLENVGPVYAFLADCGMPTTKSIWVVDGDPAQRVPGRGGSTCQDPEHLRWLLDLQSKGFEIGWHSASWNGLPREQVRAALDRFAELFQHPPATAANHSFLEGIYWGEARVSAWRRLLYGLLTRFRRRGRYRGHVEGDPYFWGDLCRERIKYYRNFVFHEINTLKACPLMPYHDAQRPWVNYWYASSDGNRVQRFNRCIAEAAQDRLEEEGGACIMYTHFACGFAEQGRVEPRFRALMERLARKNGWFVPVATLLDHLLELRGRREISAVERRRLECRWLWEKIFTGTD